MKPTPTNHFVFLNPGEKLFVITRKLAGEDTTQVVEVVFPTCGDEDDLYFDPKQSCHQEARAYFEDAMIFNMVDLEELETGCKATVTDAVANALTRKGEIAYVSVQKTWADRFTNLKADAEALKTLDVEPAD